MLFVSLDFEERQIEKLKWLEQYLETNIPPMKINITFIIVTSLLQTCY